LLFFRTEYPLLRNEASCPRKELGGGVIVLESVLGWIGTVILFGFAAEILIKIMVYRWKFFIHWGNIIDFTAVAISVSLDIVTRVRQAGTSGEIAFLVIVLRLWRIVRLVHGAIEESELRHGNQMHAIQLENRRLRMELKQFTQSSAYDH
jgi:voltage-gated hydrogen channel 1